MAVVVLGIAAAGVLLPFSSGARVRAEGVRANLMLDAFEIDMMRKHLLGIERRAEVARVDR